MSIATFEPALRPPVRRLAWPFAARAASTLRAHVTPEPDIAPPAPPPPDPGPEEAPIPVQDPQPVDPDPAIAPPPVHVV